MADIFISYAREDRAWVEKLASQLQTEGFSVWWDWDLLVGKRYRETIDTELQSCKAAVVVWSQHSVQSDFVRDEAEEAQQRNILVPVLKEVVRPPAGFRQIQTADLSTWTGGGNHAEFRRVTKGIAHMVGRPAAGDTGEVNVDPDRPTDHFEAADPAPAVSAVRQPESPPAVRPRAQFVSQPSPSILSTTLAGLPPKNHPIWRYVAFGVVGLIALLLIVAQFVPSTPKLGVPAVTTNGTTNNSATTGGTGGNVQPTNAGGTNTGGPANTGDTGDIGQTGPHGNSGSTGGGHTSNDNTDTGNAAGDSGDVGQGNTH
jgi:hypothetical protein